MPHLRSYKICKELQNWKWNKAVKKAGEGIYLHALTSDFEPEKNETISLVFAFDFNLRVVSLFGSCSIKHNIEIDAKLKQKIETTTERSLTYI